MAQSHSSRNSFGDGGTGAAHETQSFDSASPPPPSAGADLDESSSSRAHFYKKVAIASPGLKAQTVTF